MKFLDRWLIYLITRLILLHMMITGLAVLGVFVVVSFARDLIDDSLDANSLAESGTPVRLEVDSQESGRFFKDRGYQYFFKEGEYFQGYSFRNEPTRGLDHLIVYRESLEEMNSMKRLVEVPELASMISVYHSAHGKTRYAGMRYVLYFFFGWLVIVYLAIQRLFSNQGRPEGAKTTTSSLIPMMKEYDPSMRECSTPKRKNERTFTYREAWTRAHS